MLEISCSFSQISVRKSPWIVRFIAGCPQARKNRACNIRIKRGLKPNQISEIMATKSINMNTNKDKDGKDGINAQELEIIDLLSDEEHSSQGEDEQQDDARVASYDAEDPDEDGEVPSYVLFCQLQLKVMNHSCLQKGRTFRVSYFGWKRSDTVTLGRSRANGLRIPQVDVIINIFFFLNVPLTHLVSLCKGFNDTCRNW